MKITQVRLGRISTPLRVPFKTALRTVNSVEDVIVELHTDTGAVGYGEAPPTGVITGDTTGAILGAIRDHIAPALLGRDLDEFEDLTAAVQKALVHNTSAKAAVDMALWDLLGQKYSAPVYRMLGGARRNIVTDITISVNPPEEMARDARTAVQRGYDCLKVKVGIDPELDVARLAAVRQAVGRDIRLRIDANQAWNAKQAVRILNQMQEKGLDIEFVEQPVPAADLEGMQYVTRHADVPVLADESVFSPADALRIMQTGAADLVNIKLMKCGGITNALRIAAAAEVYGVECVPGTGKSPRTAQTQETKGDTSKSQAQGGENAAQTKKEQRRNTWTNEDGSIRPISKWSGVSFTDQQKADYVAGKAVKLENVTDKQGFHATMYIKFNPEKGRPYRYDTNPDNAQQVAPSNESRTQVAVNNDGKTNEATKNLREPLQKGQTNPKDARQQQQQEKPQKKTGKGMKM